METTSIVSLTPFTPGRRQQIPRTFSRTRTPAREVTLVQRKTTPIGIGLGKTSGWAHRAVLKQSKVRQVSGATYDRIDDDGLHITVDGVPQVVECDTVVVCAGQDSVRDLYDDAALERVYYPEIQALLAAVTGASRVVVFDATRRSDAPAGAQNRDGLRGPASRVHVDYTEKSGPQRLKDLRGETEAARLAAKGARIVQINVWRPIRGPVRRS